MGLLPFRPWPAARLGRSKLARRGVGDAARQGDGIGIGQKRIDVGDVAGFLRRDSGDDHKTSPRSPCCEV